MNYFREVFYEKRKNVEELQETLIDLKKEIRKLKGLPPEPNNQEIPTNLWQQDDLPEVEMTDEEINSIMITLIEKN